MLNKECDRSNQRPQSLQKGQGRGTFPPPPAPCIALSTKYLSLARCSLCHRRRSEACGGPLLNSQAASAAAEQACIGERERASEQGGLKGHTLKAARAPALLVAASSLHASLSPLPLAASLCPSTVSHTLLKCSTS